MAATKKKIDKVIYNKLQTFAFIVPLDKRKKVRESSFEAGPSRLLRDRLINAFNYRQLRSRAGALISHSARISLDP